MPDIWRTVPDSQTITVYNYNKYVRFQVGICPEKFQLDQIQNSRLSAIIIIIMCDTWQAVSDSWTITISR